jgi:HSP20 family molecular chaperone IbpA
MEPGFNREENMTTQVLPQTDVVPEHHATQAPADRIRIAPNTVAYVEKHNLILEFAIPGAPTETVDLKMLEDGVYLTAPARDIEYVAALPFSWPVKPAKAEASYEHGLLRISVPLKDPMEGAVKVAIQSGGTPVPVSTATKMQ